MVELAYIAVCCLLLPFYKWRQETDGRAYPFIGLSALYGIWLLVGGCVLPFNAITIATLAIALWLTASLIWTDHPHSVHELFNWLSYLMLFTAARTLSIESVLWCVFPVSVVFASIQLYRQILKKPDPFYMFNNTSHNAALLLSGLMSGLWLFYLTGSPILILPVVLVITAILKTKSKGAILAMFVSLLFMGFMLKDLYILLFVFALFGFGVWLAAHKKRDWKVNMSFLEHSEGSVLVRVPIYAAALAMIKSKPLYGHGLQMFRKQMPFTVAELHKKEWFSKRLGGDKITFANKVHNDHLETIIEIGLIGYVLFAYLFSQITFDVYSASFFIMAMVISQVFFYFRNTHTAVPFWVVMGSVAGIGSGTGSLVVLKAVGVAVILAVITNTFWKVVGSVYFSAAVSNPDLNTKLDLTQKAIDCDKNNGLYLNYSAYHAFQVRPQMALYNTIRGITNYDGDRQIWGLWDLFARLILNMDKIKVTEWANKNAFYFYPEHPESKETKNAIETIKTALSGDIKQAEKKLEILKRGK